MSVNVLKFCKLFQWQLKNYSSFPNLKILSIVHIPKLRGKLSDVQSVVFQCLFTHHDISIPVLALPFKLLGSGYILMFIAKCFISCVSYQCLMIIDKL